MSALLFAAVSSAALPALAQQAIKSATADGSVSAIAAEAAKSGSARIIVQMSEARAFPGAVTSISDAAYAAGVQAAATSVITGVFGSAAVANAKIIDAVPMFAIDATAAQITQLAKDPRVERIYPDAIEDPTLTKSLPIIKMTQASTGAYAHGATGAGRAVAVLDTGVDKNHEFLKGKVIAEACYSTTSTANKSKSLCPRGVSKATTSNSGLDCNGSLIEGCGHGTHVAGISAGFNSALSRGEPKNGVAKSAKVVAIQVFSRFDKSVCGTGATQDCARTYTSDQIAALSRVYALRGGVKNHKIDAVNMSLGGAATDTGYCNSDPRKPIIDKLRGVGIATVIAAGNEYYVDAVSPPGCIQTAITVSASTKLATGKPERISSYSNIGLVTDVVAPGGDFSYPFTDGTSPIQSSSGGTYKYFSGTSMAAPHVAGAIAAIRSKAACRSKTVSQIETALKSSGPLMTDQRLVFGVEPAKKRRMDVVALMKKLGCY